MKIIFHPEKTGLANTWATGLSAMALCVYSCIYKRIYSVAQLRADLEKAREELEKKQRKFETEIEVRDKQIYQLKALMAHFKQVRTVMYKQTHTHTHKAHDMYIHTHTCAALICNVHCISTCMCVEISRAMVNSCQS